MWQLHKDWTEYYVFSIWANLKPSLEVFINVISTIQTDNYTRKRKQKSYLHILLKDPILLTIVYV